MQTVDNYKQHNSGGYSVIINVMTQSAAVNNVF